MGTLRGGLSYYNYDSTAVDISSDNFNFQDIYLYPNPTKSIVYVDLANQQLKYIDVLSVDGKLLMQSKDNQIDMHDFENGIYFFEIITEQGRFVKKVLKQ